ncbi:hypothetical protein VE03_10039 [Pseudogymnoascus sp. 23342-1-I1]|nr:hypothetical protein VE03_10039 [Pseudogymnoascus sp. 23342-1-I1]
MVASLVILGNKKVGIWCSLPANQVILCACFRALNINAAVYTADLNTDEREALVRRFTTSVDNCSIFIGSFSVGSIGLNLQALCHHSIDFDSPANDGQGKQTIGRFRRIGQENHIERFELSVKSSFQSRIIQNALRKAIPSAAAELTVESTGTIMDGEVTINVTPWYRIGDELIEAPDPRVDDLPKEQQLTAAQLVDAILDIQRGKREEAVTNKRWVQEPLRDDTPGAI